MGSTATPHAHPLECIWMSAACRSLQPASSPFADTPLPLLFRDPQLPDGAASHL